MRTLHAGNMTLEDLGALPELRVLNLVNNQLVGTLPPAFGKLMGHLQELDLSGNPIQVCRSLHTLASCHCY